MKCPHHRVIPTSVEQLHIRGSASGGKTVPERAGVVQVQEVPKVPYRA